MSAALAQLIQNDFRLQWRYRIIAAYAVVIALYAAIIIAAGAQLPQWAIALIIFSDPAVLGFFFLGGLMMLEKSENVRAALAMSPASPTQYLGAKTTTLTGLAICAVTVLCLCARLPLQNLLVVLFTTVCISIMFTSIGAIVALKFKTINGYLLGSIPIILPLIAPAALTIIDPLPAIAYLIPPVAQLKLLIIAFGTGELSELTFFFCVTSCTAAAALSFVGATQFLKHELGAK